MVTTANRSTRSRVRRLETIFDDVGAQHAATPHTPQLPAPTTAAAREILDKCKQLARDSFDRKIAKTVATKILGDKSERFAGTEADAVDIFSQLMHELRTQFVLQSSAFAPLFDLTDMAVEARHEANELLLSALTFLARPGSPARDWLEASGSDVPGDGKRAALEVVRMLQERSEPFDSFELLLAVRIPSSKDPDRGIREFNGLLRDVQRSHNLPEDAVKRQFLKALGDSWLYRDLANSLARADQRQGVSLLTIQARVREQFRHGLKVSDAPVSALSFGDGASDLAAALSSLQKQLERMQQDIRDLKRQKREGPPPAGKHLTRSAAKLHRAGVKPLGTAPPVSFDKKSGAFVPHCKNARFYDAGDEHAFESLCTMEGRPEVCELSAHSFVTAEPTSLRHFQDAAASAQDAAADDDGVAHFPLATFHSGARGSIPPPPAVRDPSALVAGGVPTAHDPPVAVPGSLGLPGSVPSLRLGDSAPASLFAGMTIETSDIGSEVSDNDQGSDNGSDGGQQVAFDSFGTLEHDSDRGASPLAAPMYRPRAPPSFLRCALMSSMLCCSLLASATASLVAVGGGDRGLVEPGVTVHRSTGGFFASDPPLGSLDIRDWPPDDRVLLSLSSMFATAMGICFINSSVDLLSAVEPPCPLGPGGAQFQKTVCNSLRDYSVFTSQPLNSALLTSFKVAEFSCQSSWQLD
ncbi:hypothetical protein CYMTET_31021 [Cymbomonas tetramitiformis]|uniref:Uncharacterized protein n=1 Tax=Cymbomonas tetramitiformis TaxID=36881 RepID=A0AAE0FHM5_9CHLO|nr:hypothetical protein CYMTET_31021 [Cymbomonas tetramitiformis]